jgi:hypothetical protein
LRSSNQTFVSIKYVNRIRGPEDPITHARGIEVDIVILSLGDDIEQG